MSNYLRSAALVCLLFAPHAWPADPPKKISELHAAKLELLFYKERDTKAALEKLGNDQRAVYTAICKDAGIEAPDFAALAEVCGIDLEKRLVTRVAPTKKEK